MVVGGEAYLVVRCAVGMRLYMVSRGSVRTAARRRMGTESESAAPSRVDTDLLDLRRMKELESRSRICGQVVMLFFPRGVRRGRRDVCVRRGVKSEYACL
jgi:hypothetical protein